VAKKENDPFAAIREATLAHLRQHGCHCYPYFDGSLLGVIAGAAQASRIVELGTALGYTSISFAHGAPTAQVDTIEADDEHVRLARANIAKAGFDKRITVHHGDFDDVLPKLKPAYDVGFFDGHGPTMTYLREFKRLLRPRGVLVTTNLDVGGDSSRYRTTLTDPAQWLTTFAAEDGRTAISIKV
jgi:predicted O-methyltransferase YrrM